MMMMMRLLRIPASSCSRAALLGAARRIPCAAATTAAAVQPIAARSFSSVSEAAGPIVPGINKGKTSTGLVGD